MVVHITQVLERSRAGGTNVWDFLAASRGAVSRDSVVVRNVRRVSRHVQLRVLHCGGQRLWSLSTLHHYAAVY